MVDLTRKDIDDAARLLSLLINNAIPVDCTNGEGRDDAPPSSEQLRKAARAELARRRRRAQTLPRAMFGEPAWEMLLVLYVAEAPALQTIRRLTDLSGVTHTTALRWLDYLESHQLIRRRSQARDRRSASVELTDKGRQCLESYLLGERSAE